MHIRISTISRKGPFAVINADDYYGSHAFQVIYDYLTTHEDDDKYRYTMVGYRLKNTVTENGYVSRGICELNSDRELVSVTEHTRIEKKEDGIAYSEDGGETWTYVDEDVLVSMNIYLPAVVSDLLAEDKAVVKVLESEDKWYGVTYKEDKPVVVAAIQALKDEGLYPQKLWD